MTNRDELRRWIEAHGGYLQEPTIRRQKMPTRLITQAAAMPTRKVAATGIAGALTAAALGVLHWAAPEYAAVLAGPVEGAIVAAVAFVTGYAVRERG